jgi:extracellular elastinolytic metalloproteinase
MEALSFLAEASSGFAGAKPLEYQPDPVVQRTTSGSAAVHVKQHHLGIPIFQMGHTVRFNTTGDTIDAPGQSAIVEQGVSGIPVVDAATAVRKAAEYLASSGTEAVETDEFGQAHQLPTIEIGDFQPELLSSFSFPPRPSVFSKGPFENEIPTNLIFFVQPESSRLAWHVVLTFPEYTDQYVVIVSADRVDPEIL